MRTNRARRETYTGPWLPEPLVEPDPAERITERAAREESVSLAMLVVLETLSPAERAVFVLREVFGLSHDEVARALDRTPAAVRQLAHRAREHVQARRPRFEADDAEQRRVTEQFLAACATGQVEHLLQLLAPDVTLVSDTGGQARAPLRTIVGSDKVCPFVLGIAGNAAGFAVTVARVNGRVGVVARRDGAARYVMSFDLVDGRIATIYLVANPDKLSRVGAGSPD